MWQNTFRLLGEDTGTLAGRLLRDQVPLVCGESKVTGSLVERASAVLAARLPLHLARGERRRLVFMLPNATQSLGRFLAVSMLVADFVHRSGVGVSPDEKGRLVSGDLLLVTQHIRECVNLLRNVSIRYRSQSLSLSEIWPIEVLSQYSVPVGDKPRVFVANPGWIAAFEGTRSFGTVVVDLSHPRTSDHLERILSQSQILQCPIQVFVTPPCELERINRLREGGSVSVLAWPWDPAAIEALADVLDVAPDAGSNGQSAGRTLWIAEDEAINERLAEVHGLLVGAMKAGGGRVPAVLLESWSIYHRLRQLSVPLLRIEEQRQRSYRTLPITDRLRTIEEQGVKAVGALASYLDAHWPRLVQLLWEVYDLLLAQQEPAKFYSLAGCLEEIISAGNLDKCGVRVVVPTKQEACVLTALVGELVGQWGESLQSGKVTVTTVREEPRLVAEGRTEETVLLGFRTSDSRYLDVYPGIPVHVVCYPYETHVDEAIQRRIHDPIEDFQNRSPRTHVLQSLRLPMQYRKVEVAAGNAVGSDETPRSARPRITRRLESGSPAPRSRVLLDGEAVEPLDVGKLAGMGWSDEYAVGDAEESSQSGTERRGVMEFAEITIATGERLRFPAGRLVDVYHSTTETKERLPARSVEAGMQLIVLVDDPYEDLFSRLLEAIGEVRDLQASLALELWQTAKQAAFAKCGGNRRSLFEELSGRGLSVDYPAVVGWYAEGEHEILAPQSSTDFEVLAKFSGIYTEDALLRATFAHIATERTIRRQCGRVLSRLLAQIAAGKQYDVAVESAKAIGSPLEQLASAVTICDVEAVRLVSSLADLG
jgi:hypothetical protein